MLGIISLNNVAYADDTFANLVIKMNGAGNNNTYFLCVEEGVGCVSIEAANHGRIYPLNPGTVENIVLINTRTLREYPTPLPASCAKPVNANQTLTMKGSIVKEANDKVYIRDLKCSVG